jgi:hypothetical protein
VLTTIAEVATQTEISGSQIHTSSIGHRWGRYCGRELDSKLCKAINDEQDKDLHSGTKSKRRINLELLGEAIWNMATFAYVSRQMHTRANAIVSSLFRGLAPSKPDLFHESLIMETRGYLRLHIFQPWKFQKTIDTKATGGLNYEACNSIRSDVEELDRYTRGVIPSASTIAKYATLLERHAAEVHGLSITVEKTKHGPSLSFDLDTLLRVILVGFGLDK